MMPALEVSLSIGDVAFMAWSIATFATGWFLGEHVEFRP